MEGKKLLYVSGRSLWLVRVTINKQFYKSAKTYHIKSYFRLVVRQIIVIDKLKIFSSIKNIISINKYSMLGIYSVNEYSILGIYPEIEYSMLGIYPVSEYSMLRI